MFGLNNKRSENKPKTKRMGMGGPDEIGVIKADCPVEVPFKLNS